METEECELIWNSEFWTIFFLISFRVGLYDFFYSCLNLHLRSDISRWKSREFQNLFGQNILKDFLEKTFGIWKYICFNQDFLTFPRRPNFRRDRDAENLSHHFHRVRRLRWARAHFRVDLRNEGTGQELEKTMSGHAEARKVDRINKWSKINTFWTDCASFRNFITIILKHQNNSNFFCGQIWSLDDH